MAESMKPLRDYVLARPLDPETKTKSGLYVPDSAAEKVNKAVVKAVGDDVKGIKVNDVISYESFKSIETKSAGEDVILVREKHIAAVDTK